jgi:hypothetical protein
MFIHRFLIVLETARNLRVLGRLLRNKIKISHKIEKKEKESKVS